MLTYIYHYCFLYKTSLEIQHANTDPTWKVESWREPFFDQNFLADLQELWTKSSKEGENFQKKLQEWTSAEWSEEIPYYLTNFFDQWKSSEIDGEYVALLTEKFPHYIDEIKDLVNKYADTFTYDEMEATNQALFLLWYTEFKVLNTPKAVVINEMVELAKRYADEWSPKLLNWILEKILY